MEKIIKTYENSCHNLIDIFCNKQEIDFDGWIGDEIGGMASFNCEYFFSFSDIVLDFNTKQPKGQILNWSNEDLELNMFRKNHQHINYKSYTMGLRHNQLNKK